MPRLIITRAMEQVSGLDDVYLFFLSQSTFEIVHSLLHQAEWDIKTTAQRDVYRKASQELMTMANLQDLIDMFSEMNGTLAEIQTCICDGMAASSGVEQYRLPPEYHGENPDYVPGAEFGSHVQIPEPIANQGYDDWPLYQEYTCKAVELIRRSAVVMNEELLRITDLPAIGLGLVAAILGTVTAILATLALPAIVVGASLCATLGAAIISAGQGGLEACGDYLLDASDEVWRNIACIVRNAPNSVVAEEQIREYIAQTAPTVAVPILQLFPWDSWVNQVYLGVTVEGSTLDVTGLESLCGECEPEPGEELVTDPEMSDPSQTSYYLHPDSPCQTMPTENGGIFIPSCHVPATMLSTDITILSGDVGNTLDISWTMYKAGTSPGTVLTVMVERIETGVVYGEWVRTNQAGVWMGSGQFSVPYSGQYRVTLVLNNNQSYFDRVSVRR